MCLILFAWQGHPDYPLVVAANRDEFHQRPTRQAGFWTEQPALLAGRDLLAGGTWLGLTRSGRFAAITNYREPVAPGPSGQKSRGHLVTEFLAGEKTPIGHAESLAAAGSDYGGYNLLLGTPRDLAYVSNRGGKPGPVAGGVHGLSNHLLNTDWPKVHAGRERLQAILAGPGPSAERLFDLLTDRRLTPGELPVELAPEEIREQLMNHYFIVSPEYGTRSSTVVLVHASGRVEFAERQFGSDGCETGSRRFEFVFDGW
jgi:uncharacterized protein with NRDE domain